MLIRSVPAKTGYICDMRALRFFPAVNARHAWLILSTVIVASVINDGSTNWLEGAMLISTYIIISSAFFFFEFEGADHGHDDRALRMQ